MTARFLRWLGALVCVMVAFCAIATLAHAMGPPSHASLAVTGPSSFVGLMIGMIAIPWDPPMTKQDLLSISDPQTAGQPEVVPWQLYDTQAVTTAVNAPAVFFQVINADKTLSNMEGPGQLPDPQYLVVHYVAMDMCFATPSTAVTATDSNAAVANLENLLKTCRATFEFNMSNKRYGPFSLTMCHSTGGTTGALYGVGTLAAAVSGGAINNGVPGSGGFPFSGALVIPPKIGFDVTIRFGVAPTLVSGPINLRISLVGALYRRVL